MQDDQLKTLMTLLIIERTGSFAAAARELDITRATVSRLIADAERRLNTRLCYRTTRQVVLTDSAKALMREVERPLAHIAAALSSLSEGEGHLQGVIRLSASHAFGRHYISPLVARFMHEHPQVRVQLHLRDTIDSLVGQAIDIAIRIGGLPDSDMIARPLGQLQVALVGAPELLAEGIPQDLADLPCLPEIAYRPISVKEPRAWVLERDGVQQVYRISNAQVEVDSVEGAADLVRAGIGIAMLPLHLVSGDLASGHLRQLLPGYRAIGPDIHLCYTSRELMPQRVRTLITFLLESLGQHPL